jgi:iron complex transport system ATP-binding protein
MSHEFGDRADSKLKSQNSKLKADPIIQLHDVSVVLGGVAVLDSVTLAIADGEHSVILGPNGAGKSTLMKVLAFEHYPRAGAALGLPNGSPPPVRIFGRDRWNVSELRTQLGIVSAELHDRFVHGNCRGSITGIEAVLSGFFASQGVFGYQEVTDAMRDRAREALDLMGAARLATTTLDRMSTGEARRVVIARALVHRPRALVLDEPTRGLDLVARHRFMERVRVIARQGTTVLLVTHYPDEIIPEIERVVLIDRGRAIADGPKRDVLTADRLGALFGAPVVVDQDGGYYHVRVLR